MRENGMVEGKQYVLDERYAEGNYDRFPALTDSLVIPPRKTPGESTFNCLRRWEAYGMRTTATSGFSFS
jgi:hypothetical protein